MTPPPETRPDPRPAGAPAAPSPQAGFWRRLFGAGQDAPPAKPLFRFRPVPPVPPRGPGLPPLEEILREPPPPPEPPPLPALIAAPEPAPVEPAPEPPPPEPIIAELHTTATAAPPPPLLAEDLPAEPPARGHRPLTDAERHVLGQVAAFLQAGQAAAALQLVDAQFRDHPDAADAHGLPVHLVWSLRCTLLLGAPGPVQALIDQVRPLLAEDDPLIETMFAQAAMQLGDVTAARVAWLAALKRRPELPEATAWLAQHPVSPEGGVPALDLVAADETGRLPTIVPALPLAPAPPAPPVLPASGACHLIAPAVLGVAPNGGVMLGNDKVPMWQAALDVAGATPDDLAIVLGHPEGIGQPHAFQTVLLAAVVAQRQYLGHRRPARLYAGRQSWAMPQTARLPGGPTVQAEMLAVLFPGLRLVGDHPTALREPAVLLVDGGRHDPATGTLLGGLLPELTGWTAEARGRAFSAFGLPDTAEPPRAAERRHCALFLDAASPHTLAEPVRERLFALLGAAGYDVVTQDVAAMPWHRQVRVMYGSDLVIGVHGPALSPIVWAHPQTRVLEVFPEGCHRYETQILAEAAGLAYLGVEGVEEGGFVARTRDRWGTPTGHANKPVWALPWSLLEQALAPSPRRP